MKRAAAGAAVQHHRSASEAPPFPYFRCFQVTAREAATYVMEREGRVVHAFGDQRADACGEKRPILATRRLIEAADVTEEALSQKQQGAFAANGSEMRREKRRQPS